LKEAGFRLDDDDTSDEDDDGAAKRRPAGGSPAKASSHESESDSSEGEDKKDSPGAKKPAAVPFCQMFRFATCLDWFLLTAGLLGGAAFGAVQPLFAILFGQLLDNFGSNDLIESVGRISIYFLYIGVGSFVGIFMQYGFMAIAAERQVLRIRREYVRALLRQPMSYWDDVDAGTITSRLAEDTITISRGIGEQFGVLAQSLSATVAGIAVGFYFNWSLALVVVAFVPLMAVPMVILFSGRTAFEAITSNAYARASAVSTEALAMIRTVVAFGGEGAELRRYKRHVGLAERVIASSGIVVGLAQAFFWICIMGAYAASLYFGATRVIESRNANPLCANPVLVALAAQGTENCFSGGDVVLVFFSVLTGGFTLGQAGPAVSAIAAARVAAAPIFEAIDAESTIDPLVKTPSRPSVSPAAEVKPRTGKGIEFVDVGFCYPRQPDVWVLRNFNLSVETGKTVALVGPSGSGKSSAMQLLLRFYDPNEGAIFIDGVNIQDIPVQELRAKMGFVEQKPKLFNTTIEENIALGLTDYISDLGTMDPSGLPLLDDETKALVEGSLKAASAWEFVTKLPEGTRTTTGDGGSTLSGGQRQRVCIARAIVRKPSILLLDEATSALDSRSEAEVQSAIDALLRTSGADLTVMVIAHRLATVRGADSIAVIHDGRVEDLGTHEELLAREGRYAAMHQAQVLGTHESAVTTSLPAVDSSEVDTAIVAAVEAAPPKEDHPEGPDPTAFRSIPVLDKLSKLLRFELPETSKGCCGTRSAPKTAPVKLSSESPEVMRLMQALAEMTEGERSSTLSWWLKNAYNPSKGDEADALADDVEPVVLPPNRAMVDESIKQKTRLEDTPPRTETLTPVLYLTPVPSRNRLLGMLLLQSLPTVSFSAVLQYQQPEWGYFILCFIGCALAGAVFPAQSVIFAYVLDALFSPDNDVVLRDATTGAWLFLLAGGVAAVGVLLQFGAAEYIGSKLTSRMRVQVYGAILRQDIAFHDYEYNSVGRLTARLATDAALIRRTTGEKMGMVLQSFAGFAVGLGIAFAASWQLSLVILAIGPLLAIFRGMVAYAMNGSNVILKEALEGATSAMYDAASNIRTVSSLGTQTHVLRQVDRATKGPLRVALRLAAMNGFGQGVLQFVLFGAYSLAFYAGAVFIEQGVLDFEGLLRAFLVLSFMAMSAGGAQEFAGDLGKADSAKRAAFALFNRASRVNTSSEGGAAPESFKGRIEFKNVWFAYPARPDTWALRDFSVVLEPGEQVGLCGESGSGKSTIVQLLMRFYDPARGIITLDGRDLRDYNVNWLRSQFGLVQQQPDLFADTISYNILYGNVPTSESATTSPGLVGNKPIAEQGLGTVADSSDHPEAIAAARKAHAHGFVSRKIWKYATPAGVGGTAALSGGQAQRVAIARALIRKAPIFLADEATSALDSVSERKVQRALSAIVSEASSEGAAQTSLVIAHRLSTIKGSDKIILLERGTLAELGTHAELITRPLGKYRALAVAQDGSV
jgi:ATP-binding cassette, subfamily B (MDR/TAP), member 1